MDADEIIKLLVTGRKTGPFVLFGPDRKKMDSIREALKGMEPEERASILERVNAFMETAKAPGGRPGVGRPMFKEDERNLIGFLNKNQVKTFPRGAEQNKPNFNNPNAAPAAAPAAPAPAPAQGKVEQNFPMPNNQRGQGVDFDQPDNLAPMEVRGRAPAGPIVDTSPAMSIAGGVMTPVKMDELPEVGEKPGPGASQLEIDAYNARLAERTAVERANADRASNARDDWQESMVLKGGMDSTSRQWNDNVIKNRRTADRIKSINNPLMGNRLSDWFDAKNREHGENSRYKDYKDFNDLYARNPNAALALADQFKYISAANAKPITQASENAKRYAESEKKGLRAYADENGLQYLPANHPKVAVPEGTQKGTVTFKDPYNPEGLDNPFSERPLETAEREGIGFRNPVLSGGPAMSPLGITGPRRADFDAPTRAMGAMRDLEEERRRSRSYSPDELTGSWGYGSV